MDGMNVGRKGLIWNYRIDDRNEMERNYEG